MQQNHGIKKVGKTWRKRHIGLGPGSGEVVTSALMSEHVCDEAAIREAFGSEVEIVIPPPSDAIQGDGPMRNAHIERHGRMAWQKATGDTDRSCVEAQIAHYKSVICRRLRSRKLEAQQPKQPSL